VRRHGEHHVSHDCGTDTRYSPCACRRPTNFIRAVSENEYISVCVGDVRVEGQGVNNIVSALKTAAKKLKSEKNKKKG